MNTVKDHSDNKRGNPLSPHHGLFFPISSKGSFISTILLRILNQLLFVYTYFYAFIHLRFKHAVLGTHTSACWAVCLGQ